MHKPNHITKGDSFSNMTSTIISKKCSSCKQLKPLFEYASNRSRPDGLQTTCKTCFSAYKRQKRREKAVIREREKALANLPIGYFEGTPFTKSHLKKFWEKVNITPRGCWEWQAGLTINGYGKYGFSGKTIMAHRFAYFLYYQTNTAGHFVFHECNNPACVNPLHLSAKSLEGIEQERINKQEQQQREKLLKQAANPIVTTFNGTDVRKNDIARFWSKVKIGPTCWEWQGIKQRRGYGRIQIQRRMIIASRFAYFLYYLQDPKDLFVCHTCDNPSCVNPLHLFLGTALDNNRDRDRKGRAGDLRGEKCGHNTLTESQVLEIRRLYKPFEMGYKKLGKMFNVTPTTIHKIVHRQRWKHI